MTVEEFISIVNSGNTDEAFNSFSMNEIEISTKTQETKVISEYTNAKPIARIERHGVRYIQISLTFPDKDESKLRLSQMMIDDLWDKQTETYPILADNPEADIKVRMVACVITPSAYAHEVCMLAVNPIFKSLEGDLYNRNELKLLFENESIKLEELNLDGKQLYKDAEREMSAEEALRGEGGDVN